MSIYKNEPTPPAKIQKLPFLASLKPWHDLYMLKIAPLGKDRYKVEIHLALLEPFLFSERKVFQYQQQKKENEIFQYLKRIVFQNNH